MGVLRLVQRATEQQERLLVLTAELKKGLLDQLFPRGLCNEPQKQTEIGPIPQSWEVVELGCIVRNGKGQCSTPKAQGGIEYVDVSGISREFCESMSSNSYQLKDAPGRSQKEVKEGDIICARWPNRYYVLPVFRRSLTIRFDSTAYVQNRCRYHETKLRPTLFYYLFTHAFLKRFRIESARGFPAVKSDFRRENSEAVRGQQEIAR